MANRVAILVGTKKGAFIAESDKARKTWSVRGPYLESKNVMHMAYDHRTDTLLAGAEDWWFGSRVHSSNDLGNTWDEPQSGPVFPEGSGEKLAKVWHVEPGRPEEPGVIYAGVEPAALFKSIDNGQTWQWVEALSKHPTREQWQPSAGGLGLHTIILDPQDMQKMYIAISAAGVFRTDDGGATWTPKNKGTRADFMPGEPSQTPEFGQCVHKVVMHPGNPSRLFQQNHCGVYRSDDGAESWTEITTGLPSDWGLPMAIHAHDGNTVYICPGVSGMQHWVPGGQMAVWRSRDGGQSWLKQAKGMPTNQAYVNVMREGMATDTLDPCGVYVGTNTGQLFSSPDEGDSWQQVPTMFPPILSVGVVTL